MFLNTVQSSHIQSPLRFLALLLLINQGNVYAWNYKHLGQRSSIVSSSLMTELLESKSVVQDLTFCTLLIFESAPVEYSAWEQTHDNTEFYKFFRDRYVVSEKGPAERAHSDLHKNASPLTRMKNHGANCVVSVIFVPTLNSLRVGEFLRGLMDILTLPTLLPLTKRNEDYFVFFAETEKMVKTVLESEYLSFRITHKIALAVETPPIMKTLCFYCNNGLPQKIPVPVEYRGSKMLFPPLLRNFQGGLIRGSAATAGPSTQMRRGKDGKWRPFLTGGPFLRNFLTAAQALNFTFDIRPSIGGGGTGLKAKNGTWFGVVGDVLYGNVDIGAVSGVTLDRFFVVEFSSPIDYLALSFTHGPMNPIYTWKSVFWPFDQTLWIYILTSTGISFACLQAMRLFVKKVPVSNSPKEDEKILPLNTIPTITHPKDIFKVTPKSAKNSVNIAMDIDIDLWSVSETILFLLPSFLSQTFIKTRDPTLQVFSIFWFLFIIVITTVYLSKLFGFFVEPPLEVAPETFEALAHSDYHLGMTYYGGAIYSWFQNANAKTAMGIIFKRMEKRKTFDCLRATLDTKRKYACISYQSSIEYAIQVKIGDRYGRSKIIMEPTVAFEIPISLTTERRSILIQSVNRVTSGNFEAGLTTLWRSWTHTDLRTERLAQERRNNMMTPMIPDSSQPQKLKMDHFTGAYTILFWGLLASLIAFALERCWNWRGRIKRRWNYYWNLNRSLTLNNSEIVPRIRDSALHKISNQFETSI